ncbi:hypothetical protein ACFLTJ_03510 [Chloroflexota bacterium]
MPVLTRFQLLALVALLFTGAIIFTSCNNSGGEPAPRETRPPEVYISLDPMPPVHGDHITFTAAAEDESGIDTLAIFVDGENIKQCQGSSTDTHLQCSTSLGPYNQRQVIEYWAVAVDHQGNNAQSSTKRIEVLPLPMP